MAFYSATSKARLMTCHPDLIHLFEKVLELGYDHVILEGHRDQEAQHKAFVEGKSQLDWPNGNHNAIPSNAVDAAPWIDGKPVMGHDAKETQQLCHFAGFVQGIADNLKIKIRWGGDWNENFSIADNHFNDLFHFEISKK